MPKLTFGLGLPLVSSSLSVVLMYNLRILLIAARELFDGRFFIDFILMAFLELALLSGLINACVLILVMLLLLLVIVGDGDLALAHQLQSREYIL